MFSFSSIIYFVAWMRQRPPLIDADLLYGVNWGPDNSFRCYFEAYCSPVCPVWENRETNVTSTIPTLDQEKTDCISYCGRNKTRFHIIYKNTLISGPGTAVVKADSMILPEFCVFGRQVLAVNSSQLFA